MTRLTAEDVGAVVASLPALDRRLRRATGFDLVALACMTARGPIPAEECGWLSGVEVCVVPVTSGQGTIAGFVEAVAAVCSHLGCHSRVAGESDVSGLAFAAERGAEVVLMADDDRFIALNLSTGTCIDNSLATGHAYAMALHGVASGAAGKPVLVLGLGPVGLAACATLRRLGASILTYDPDPSKSEVAERFFSAVSVGSVEEGLGVVDLVLDASPAPDLIPEGWVSAASAVAGPGIPTAVTPAAAEALGARLIHEPLALGVAAMVAQSCLGIWTDLSTRPPRRRRRARARIDRRPGRRGPGT